ncbi:hypothetical protein ACOSQ3_014503 [Xanthoceras sorbifolium]
MNLEVCTVAPLASLSRADLADQRHLGVLKGGVTSPVEVLLNDGGPGGTVGLERVDACLARVAVGKARQDMSHVPFLHGVHKPLVTSVMFKRDKSTFRGLVLCMESMRSWCMSLLLTCVMFKRDKITFRGRVLCMESMRRCCMSLLLSSVMFKRDKSSFRGRVLCMESMQRPWRR